MSDDLVIAGKSFASRLIVGTGKYRTDDEMTEAIAASGADMVTVALKRIDFESDEKTILDHIDWGEYHIPAQTPPAARPSRRPSTPRGWRRPWASPTG